MCGLHSILQSKNILLLLQIALMTPLHHYPPSPQGIDENIILPSENFKKEVTNVISIIVAFIVGYVCLILVGIGLAVACTLLGLGLLTFKVMWLTILIALGLIGVGIMVCYFLIKFLFKKSVKDTNNLVEITPEEQPTLYAFISQLAQETQTTMPKKIFISGDVNACVFYDSSFWSMFFPIKKNLQIGLGLVNSVNISEFKAIIAHEFGHFSQRSMKLGSYIYHVNKVIYNLLYDNQGYEATLQAWANWHEYFYIFAKITHTIVGFIQKILQYGYKIINKNYMSLSRQMEFHADSVAAYVSGSQPLINSLYRLELADAGFQQVIGYYNKWTKENIKTDNFYPHHKEMMKYLAEHYGIAYQYDLPQVQPTDVKRLFNFHTIKIQDQWASHPTNEQREQHLAELNIPTTISQESAWLLFDDAEKLQQKLTALMYGNVKFENNPQAISLHDFKQKFQAEIRENSYPKIYQGFFDGQLGVTHFDIEAVLAETYTLPTTLEELFEPTYSKLPVLIKCVEDDINTLKEIENNEDINFFDFEGQKYSKKDSEEVLAKLQTSLEEKQAAYQAHCELIFRFFYEKMPENQQENYVAEWKNFLTMTNENMEQLAAAYNVMAYLQALFGGNISVETAKEIVHYVQAKEAIIKPVLQKFLQLGTLMPYLEDSANLDVLIKYVAQPSNYYYDGIENNVEFHQDHLQVLAEAIQIYLVALEDYQFKSKKKILVNQLELIGADSNL